MTSTVEEGSLAQHDLESIASSSHLSDAEDFNQAYFPQALLNACREGDLESVSQLLDQGVSASPSRVEDAHTSLSPLYVASFQGHVDIVQRLLDAGAFVTTQALYQRVPAPQKMRQNTPLHWACVRGHVEVAWVLLEAGYRLEDTDPYLNNCLHLGASGGHLGIVELALAYGANPHVINRYGNSPLDVTTHRQIQALIRSAKATKFCQVCQEQSVVPLTMCQHCHCVVCTAEACSQRQLVKFRQNTQKRLVRKCLKCVKSIYKSEQTLYDELRIVLPLLNPDAKVVTIEDPEAKMDENLSEFESHPEENHEEKEDRATTSEDGPVILSTSKLEKLLECIEKVEKFEGNVDLIQQARETHLKLGLTLELTKATESLQALRPVTLRRSMVPLTSAVTKATNEGLAKFKNAALELAQTVLTQASIEVDLAGYIELCHKIECGEEKHLADIGLLRKVLEVGLAASISPSLLGEGQGLLDRLQAEVDLAVGVKPMGEVEVETDKSGQPVMEYTLPDGTITRSLLEAINGRVIVIQTALDKAKSSTSVRPTLIEAAEVLLKDLTKQYKDERKLEDERKKLEEEAAAKAAKMSSKKGKKKK